LYFTAFGGADEIGASCYLLKVMDHRILVDCGLRPSAMGKASLPDLDAMPQPDVVFVTHAHLDHSGALPLLRQRYPDVPILVSHATYTLLKVLLADAVQVMQDERVPLYDMEAVTNVIHSLTIQEEGLWFRPLPDVVACLAPAGHILGAVMVLLDTPEGRVAFSGDVSLTHQHTVQGARLPDFTTDVLVLESTYGASQHADRATEERALARTVAEVIVRGGVVLVPSFAVGRAQEVILTLRTMQRAGAIPAFPIYIDGMVRAVCAAYRQHWRTLSPELQAIIKAGEQPFRDQWIRGVSPKWRHKIPGNETCCIVSSSGMLTGGPSVGYAQRLLGNPRNAILFPGYTDEESPGRKLQTLQPGDTLTLDGEQVVVRAQVARVNLSAHADGPQLAQLAAHLRPRAVVLVHGEPGARGELGQMLGDAHTVFQPEAGKQIVPFPSPRWLGSSRASRRYPGQVRYTDRRVIVALSREILKESPWTARYLGQDDVNARFLGERLVIEPGTVPEEGATAEVQPLKPVKERDLSASSMDVLVESPVKAASETDYEEDEVEDLLPDEYDQWYASAFACMICGAAKQYYVDLEARRVSWKCPECGAAYDQMIMRVRNKDIERMEANEKLRLLQFIHVSLRLHEPVLPDNWKDLVSQRFWERWLS
jgi:Cft2 family RNA processing exonuclease